MTAIPGEHLRPYKSHMEERGKQTRGNNTCLRLPHADVRNILRHKDTVIMAITDRAAIQGQPTWSHRVRPTQPRYHLQDTRDNSAAYTRD
jgi:hypothetical protein